MCLPGVRDCIHAVISGQGTAIIQGSDSLPSPVEPLASAPSLCPALEGRACDRIPTFCTSMGSRMLPATSSDSAVLLRLAALPRPLAALSSPFSPWTSKASFLAPKMTQMHSLLLGLAGEGLAVRLRLIFLSIRVPEGFRV